MANSIPVHHYLADMLIEMMQKGSHRKVSYDKVNTNGHYETFQADTASFMIDQEIVILDTSIYDGLKINGVKLLIEIQRELQQNNPIWECKTKQLSEVRSAIAQLKEKDILRTLPGTDLYIVNPEKLRRGRPLTILAAIYDYCKRQYERDRRWRLSNIDVKRLLAPKELNIVNIN